MGPSRFDYKVLQLLLVFAFVVYTTQTPSPEFLKKFETYKDECEKETGVDSDTAKKAMDTNHFPTNDTKLSCYFKCISIKLGTMNDAGEVVDDKLHEVAMEFLDDPSTEKEIVAECGALEGKDLCATALKLMACVKAAILD